MHHPGGRFPQQGSHVHAGAEVGEAPFGVTTGGGPIIGGAPTPVSDPIGEQHRAIDDEHRDDDVEGELEGPRDVAEHLTGDW